MYQQLVTNQKKLRDRNETPIPNQGQKSLAKVYSRPIVYELKLSNSCKRKHKKRYTDVHFELDTSYSSKNRTTMTTQPIVRVNHGIPFTTDLTGATPFMMLKIDDRYPNEWNGHGPVQYDKILVLFFFMIKIDDRYPDEWNE